MSAKAKSNAAPEPSGLAGKLVWVRENIGDVEKSKTNTHLRYQYRTEDDYYNAVRPLLDAQGVMLYVSDGAPVVADNYVAVTMHYTYVDAATGERETMTATGLGDLLDHKGARDATGLKKAKTGAARYHFQKVFLIAEGSDDDHSTADDERHVGTPRPAPPPKPAPAPKSAAPALSPEARRARVALLKSLANWAKIPLRDKLDERGKAGTDDLTDAELTAWVKAARAKLDAASGETVATLRDLINDGRGNIAVVLSDYAVSQLDDLSEREATELIAEMAN